MNPASTVSDEQYGRANSVITRLRVISGVTKVVWMIVGLLLGLLVGLPFSSGSSGIFILILIAGVGAGIGYFLGDLSAVFIDWAAELLALQLGSARPSASLATAPSEKKPEPVAPVAVVSPNLPEPTQFSDPETAKAVKAMREALGVSSTRRNG